MLLFETVSSFQVNYNNVIKLSSESWRSKVDCVVGVVLPNVPLGFLLDIQKMFSGSHSFDNLAANLHHVRV